MAIHKFFTAMCALMLVTNVSGQTGSTKYDLYDLNENGNLSVFNRNLTSFSEKGYKGIRFSENDREGIAWLTDLNFKNGIIELDIRGKDVLQRSFAGVAFHGIDGKTYDAIYFRPFNFLSSDSIRRIHAVQYISHPDFTWARLRTEQTGKFEKGIPSAPNPDDWFHVKIIIDYPHISVYVNNSIDPCLSISKLNERRSGKIGVWVGDSSGGDFANFMITNK